MTVSVGPNTPIIYAHERAESSTLNSLLFTSRIVLSFVFSALILLYFTDLIIGGLNWIYWMVAFVLVLFNSYSFISSIRSQGITEVLARRRDLMWHRVSRDVLLPFVDIGVAIALLLIELFFIGYIALAFGLVGYILYQGTTYGGELFLLVVGTTVGLVILIATVMLLRRRSVDGGSPQSAFPARITYAVPGFVGMANGYVYVEKSRTILRARTGSVRKVVPYGDLLLVLDEKNDLFLWRYRHVWVYVGYLQWIQKDMWEGRMEFRKEIGNRPKIRQIKLREGKLILQVDGKVLARMRGGYRYYVTDTVGERMNLRALGRAQGIEIIYGRILALRRGSKGHRVELVRSEQENEQASVRNQGVRTTVQSKSELNPELFAPEISAEISELPYDLSQDKSIMPGSPELTAGILAYKVTDLYAGKRLWAILGERIYSFRLSEDAFKSADITLDTYTPLASYMEYKLQKSRFISQRIPSSEDLVISYVTRSIKGSNRILLIDHGNTQEYFQLDMNILPLYFDGTYLHYTKGIEYFKVHTSMLQRAEIDNPVSSSGSSSRYSSGNISVDGSVGTSYSAYRRMK